MFSVAMTKLFGLVTSTRRTVHFWSVWKVVQHEGTNHQVAKAAFFIAGIHLQPN